MSRVLVVTFDKHHPSREHLDAQRDRHNFLQARLKAVGFDVFLHHLADPYMKPPFDPKRPNPERLPVIQWRPQFDFNQLEAAVVTQEIKDLKAELVTESLNLDASMLFDLQEVNGIVPQTGCELFFQVARNNQINQCTALMGSTAASFKGLFNSNNCQHKPQVSSNLDDLITWYDNFGIVDEDHRTVAA